MPMYISGYRNTSKMVYDGLSDKRGHHKSEDELDEVELLRRKLEKAERELKVARLENRLLKKVDEIERRRYGERADLRQNIRPSKKPLKK